MSGESRLFAVVPGAGRSRRMGRPKLLLPLAGETVLRRLLTALDRPRIAATVLVVRRGDADLLAEANAVAATQPGVVVVTPEVDPPDMRASVEQALGEITSRFSPGPEEGWLLVPGDHPVLSASAVDRLIAAWDECDVPILLPVHEGRRGHPVILRWGLAAAVSGIPADRGLNHLVAEHANLVTELAVDDPGVVLDLDTPEDYARLRGDWET